MEDRRCKLGLAGRLELVTLIERGSTLRAAAAALNVAPATAHRWWSRWRSASSAERASCDCLRTRRPVPGSCPWALSDEQEQAILEAREKTNWGPMRLTYLTGRHRSTVWKVLHRHGRSRRRRSCERQTTRRYEWAEAGALLHIDAYSAAKFDQPGTGRPVIAQGSSAAAEPARPSSSASATTTLGWSTASSTRPRTPPPSQPRSSAQRGGLASRAAGRSRP